MSIKRTIITTILALALVAVAVPAVTQADQLTDLMNQITALTAQLHNLQGTSGTTTTSTGACAGVTFTRNLYVGNTGTDVSCLQQIVGSTVMGTYGPNTKAHVVTFQKANGITATGNVGPRTIAALTSAMGTTTTTTTTTTTGTTTTGLCPNGYTLASNCTTGATQATVGTVGFISIPELAASPASNANVTATTNVPVLGVDIRAIGSDMTVTSAKVQLTVTKGGNAEHPATSVRTLYVYDGSTLLGTYPVTTNSVIKDSSNYYVILSGFSFKVPVNSTKPLTVSADFAPALETSRQITVNLYNGGAAGAGSGTDAVRATDSTGAYTTSSNSGTRVYTITYTTVGTSTLTVSTDTATTTSASVNVNHTSGTTNVPMLVFDAKSTTGASRMTDVKFTVIGNSASAIAKVSAIKLYDGSTLLSSASLTATTATLSTASFSNLTVDVAQDATKVLTVKADFASGVTNGNNVYVAIAAAGDVIYTTPNLSTGTPTGTATGQAMYLFDGNAAVLTFQSATNTYYPPVSGISSTGYTNGVITFKMHADGGTLTALTNATAGTANTVTVNSNGSPLAASAVHVDFAPVGGTNGANVSDGGDAIVTVTATSTSTGFINYSLGQVYWTVGTSGTAGQQTWGLGDYKTPYINVK